MNQRITYIRWCIPVMLLALLLPQFIQQIHALHNNHHITHCTTKTIVHFHKSSDNCPINQYVFANGIENTNTSLKQKSYSYAQHLICKPQNLKLNTATISLYLRAPPFLTI